jgi:predicted transcriptional regulator
VIIEQQPDSLEELEHATGRKRRHISQALETMAHYGIVELTRHNSSMKPIVKATDVHVEFSLTPSF